MIQELRGFIEEPDSFPDLTTRALERVRNEEWFHSDHKIALEFLRTFGAYGVAGDRHLAEFVPWFLRSESDLHRYGVVATPYSWRIRRFQERLKRDPSREAESLEASGEEGVRMIRALLGGTVLRTNVNLPNSGQVPWLEPGHPVETYAEVSGNTITPEAAGRLPPVVCEIQRRVVAVQQLTFEAAISRDTELLLQALLMDPLVHLPTTETRIMLDEMLDAASAAIRNDPLYSSL